eukprot:4876549-Pyramimonas_sp.AAC.1
MKLKLAKTKVLISFHGPGYKHSTSWGHAHPGSSGRQRRRDRQAPPPPRHDGHRRSFTRGRRRP